MVFTISLFALLTLGALTFISAPLLRARRIQRKVREHEIEALLKEKLSLLLLLRDLEFDHSTGKILDPDYAASRDEAEARAIAVLRRLDELGVRGVGGDGAPGREMDPRAGAAPDQEPRRESFENPPASRSETPPGESRPSVSALLLAFLLLVSGGAAPARSQDSTGVAEGAGTISGFVFSANHPDSLAGGASLILAFSAGDGRIRHLEATAGSDGSFRFSGLSTLPRTQYVLRVDFRGLSFLGEPVHFDPGQTERVFNVLVTGDVPAEGAGGDSGERASSGGTGVGAFSGSGGMAGSVAGESAGLPEGGLPDGHPPVGSAVPVAGRPVADHPGLTLLITGGILGFFALPVWVLHRRDRRLAG